jgi:FtsZ-binding cell division protein ZapB
LAFKQFPNTYRKPSRVRSIKAIKALSEVAMLMVAIRKLKEENDKWKKETKGINHKHNSKKSKIEKGLQSETV